MQSSISIVNGTGAEVLQQMNNAFETLATNFTGSSEPATTYASMFWVDTSETLAVLKQRNSDNTAWVLRGTFLADGSFETADKAVIETKTITLGTTWSGTSAPYMQEISVEDLLSTDNPVVGLVQSSDYSAAQAQLADYGKLYRMTTADGTATFYAKESTSNNLTLQLKIIR